MNIARTSNVLCEKFKSFFNSKIPCYLSGLIKQDTYIIFSEHLVNKKIIQMKLDNDLEKKFKV